MKKRFFFLPMLMAATAFVGCSNDDEIAGSDKVTGEGETNYLSVNLVQTTGGTRAEEEEKPEFEDGIEPENKVSSVRFYFFDINNNAAAVKFNGDSYYDWTPTVAESFQDDEPTDNIEKALTATIVISTKDGDDIPSQIVAILNPDADVLGTDNLSLRELMAKVAEHTETENFVMSNSIYANGNEIMSAVSVAGHLESSEEAAIANPVTIHVERVLAKVRLTLNLDGITVTTTDEEGEEEIVDLYSVGTYKVAEYNEETESFEIDEKPIYARFLGWNVTGTANSSYLLKKIDTAWSWENWIWNDITRFRSYWATNPDGLEFTYGDFKTHAQAVKSFKNTAEENERETNVVYVQENALNGGFDTTQVIIAAQLVDAEGKAIELTEWANNQYVGLDALKLVFANSSKLYKKTTNDEGETVYTKIEPTDIKFSTKAELPEVTPVDGKDAGLYYVYAHLTDAAAQLEWSSSDKNGDADKLEIGEVNQVLKDFGFAKVWTTGYTYYYFNIAHLVPAVKETVGEGEEAIEVTTYPVGSLGVVRNHIYAATINSIKGLGTPVYNPEETIYPEKPTDDYTYIAAEIHILSWHVVNQDVDLVW